jgi:glyoxylase-like metal-dependent hydrolase (beta-lactamase superfamily II)
MFFHFLLAYDYNLTPIKVSDSTHCFFGAPEVMDERNNGNMVNSCFVDVGTSYLVIDSGPTYLYAQQAYSAIKKIKNQKISYVVNTHVHDDHWLGNSYYDSLGIKIIGSSTFETLEKEKKTRMQMRITTAAFDKTTQVFPTIFVENEKILKLNNVEIHIKNINNKAHTDSDLLVYIPKYLTLFAGDLIFNDRLPSIRDGNIANWIEALDNIRDMNMKYVIGGHGELIDSSSIEMTYNYLGELNTRVVTLLEKGEDIGDVVNAVVMPKYKDVNFYKEIHRQNVEITYRMLEWGE